MFFKHHVFIIIKTFKEPLLFPVWQARTPTAVRFWGPYPTVVINGMTLIGTATEKVIWTTGSVCATWKAGACVTGISKVRVCEPKSVCASACACACVRLTLSTWEKEKCKGLLLDVSMGVCCKAWLRSWPRTVMLAKDKTAKMERGKSSAKET